MKAHEFLPEKWSTKYKRSINCKNPRGFSQRAHCQGKKKHSGRKIAEHNLSWTELDPGLSITDKIIIFEEYCTNNNLSESVDADKKDYFKSLIPLSSRPVKNQFYIVVPLALIANKLMLLDKPEYLKFLTQTQGQMVFSTETGTKKFPSETIRDRSICNTFTFKTQEQYNKFRVALTLKFDVSLPDIPVNKTLDERINHATAKSLVIFDIDDTLLHTTAKIKVVKDGVPVRSLTNQEFNNYTLKPGETFDFGEFKDAEKFNRESEPIEPMIKKLKTILAYSGDSQVIMLTARADFDDKELFLKTFSDLGIDMSRVHVHRAGNLPGDEIPAEKKAVWVRRYLNTGKYNHVRLYDDSMSNLKVFKGLKSEYPEVDFRAYYVGPAGSTSTVENRKQG